MGLLAVDIVHNIERNKYENETSGCLKLSVPSNRDDCGFARFAGGEIEGKYPRLVPTPHYPSLGWHI
jgi:hypothetical protein